MTLEKTIRDLNNKLMDNGRQPNMSLIGDRLDEGGMLNIDKARKLLYFKPRVSTPNGVEKYLKFLFDDYN